MSKTKAGAVFGMEGAVRDHNAARRGIPVIVVAVTAAMLLAFRFSASAPAGVGTVAAAPLCGDGFAPDYGLTYDLQQAHWTVGWQGYASVKAVTEVDAVLDRLNGDSIAQTMILILPQDQVGNRVNCAVHFLRYMKLGEPTGERQDNGFVFLIVVEPAAIDVHYGVGLGLPALTAPDLTNLNRAAEATYQSTHSMDQTLLTLVQGFDTLARSKYAPLISPAPASSPTNPPPAAGVLGGLPLSGQLCLGVVVLLVVIWGATRMDRQGFFFDEGDLGSRGMRFPMGGGRGRGGSSMRGGSGGGRSGRGN